MFFKKERILREKIVLFWFIAINSVITFWNEMLPNLIKIKLKIKILKNKKVFFLKVDIKF